MKKLFVFALIVFILAFLTMATMNKPHLSMALFAIGMIAVFLMAAKHERDLTDKYKNSELLMCSEGVIRHVKFMK